MKHSFKANAYFGSLVVCKFSMSAEFSEPVNWFIFVDQSHPLIRVWPKSPVFAPLLIEYMPKSVTSDVL